MCPGVDGNSNLGILANAKCSTSYFFWIRFTGIILLVAVVSLWQYQAHAIPQVSEQAMLILYTCSNLPHHSVPFEVMMGHLICRQKTHRAMSLAIWSLWCRSQPERLHTDQQNDIPSHDTRIRLQKTNHTRKLQPHFVNWQHRNISESECMRFSHANENRWRIIHAVSVRHILSIPHQLTARAILLVQFEVEYAQDRHITNEGTQDFATPLVCLCRVRVDILSVVGSLLTSPVSLFNTRACTIWMDLYPGKVSIHSLQYWVPAPMIYSKKHTLLTQRFRLNALYAVSTPNNYISNDKKGGGSPFDSYNYNRFKMKCWCESACFEC